MKKCIQDWLYEQFGGDEKLVNEIYDMYETNLEEGVHIMEDLIDANDKNGLLSKAHSIKGLALTVGDTDASNICKEIEFAAREENLMECKQKLQSLKQ